MGPLDNTPHPYLHITKNRIDSDLSLIVSPTSKTHLTVICIAPDSAGGSYSAPQTPYSWIFWRRGKEWGREGKRKKGGSNGE